MDSSWSKSSATNMKSELMLSDFTTTDCLQIHVVFRYHANSWLVKITSNGRYLLAPTIYGQIFVFNMLSGQVTAIIKEHQDVEIRDVIFHPYRSLIFSCGDGNVVALAYNVSFYYSLLIQCVI